MQDGINCLYGVVDFIRTGVISREADIGLGVIWKFMIMSIKRAESGL